MPRISDTARVVHSDPRDAGWATIQVRVRVDEYVHPGDQGTLESEDGMLIFRKQQPVVVG